jgi:hypothetical protein
MDRHRGGERRAELRGDEMDPYQINAAYRQNELLDEARADGLLKLARAGREGASMTALRDVHGRIVGFARSLTRARRAPAPSKATV